MDGAGNKARDLAGKFDFDTFSNGPAWTVNELGRVLNTGGNSNSRLQRSTNIDGTALAIAGDISFALWFKTPATWGPFRYLLDTNNDNGTDGWTIQTDNPSTSGMSVTLGGIGADVFFANAKLQLEKVHLLILTRAGASVSIYIDGRLAETVNTFGTGSISYSGSKLTLGASATADNLHANIDVIDFRIFSRRLAAREAAALYSPAARGALYRRMRVPLVWPAAGGAVPVQAAASLGGGGALSARAGATRLACAILAGEGTLALAPNAAHRAAAALLGGGRLQAVATVARGVAAGLIAEADLGATAGGAQATAAAVAGEAALALVPSGPALALVALTGEAALSAKAVTAGAAASLAGEGELVAIGKVSRSAALRIIARSGLIATASAGATGAAALVGEALLSGSVAILVPASAGAAAVVYVVPADDWLFTVPADDWLFKA